MQLTEVTKTVISRWIRVVIQLSLLQNSTTTEGLMPQLIQMLRGNKVGIPETHWIAATLWNKALDHYALHPVTYYINGRANDLMSCNKWCQHAISVSRFADDDGMLEKTVCPHFKALTGC
jgi:hypothetical protein